jgi:predicted dehydrogenase
MLRLGLLSTARINGAILDAAGHVDAVEVVAVASRDGERARAYAAEHGLERAHGSYEALLGDDGVDAVYISLPNGLHHEWTLRSLEAGKHVLVEKPYSRHPDDVEAAWGTAQRAGRIVMEAFMYRHHPQVATARALVKQGAVGRLRLVTASFSFPLADPENVRLVPELDGGALMDVGCYCVSGSRLLAGEPDAVFGHRVLGPTGVDLEFHGLLRLPDEVIARFDCSFALPSRQRLEAVGTDGTLVLEAPWRSDWGGRVLLNGEPVDVPAANPFERELANFAAAAAEQAKPLLGREDALAQARVLDALHRSAGSGDPVRL